MAAVLVDEEEEEAAAAEELGPSAAADSWLAPFDCACCADCAGLGATTAMEEGPARPPPGTAAAALKPLPLDGGCCCWAGTPSILNGKWTTFLEGEKGLECEREKREDLISSEA